MVTGQPQSPSAQGSREEPSGHRDRLIAAMAASIEQKGYRETTVADVVRIAHTSRRTFYEHFEDREACFLALFEETNEQSMEQIAAAVQADAPWEEQVDHALDAYLDSVTARPALYQSFVRELPGLGQPGAERGLAVIERFAQLLVALVESGRREQPEVVTRALTMDMAVMIVGGLRELMVISMQQGRDLHELRSSIGEGVKAILNAAVLRR
jgi:AcrR family transcriptional regulator